MPPDAPLATDLDDARLDRALGDYFDRVGRGEAIDRAAWIEAQPDLADALRAFFEGEDRLGRLTVPLRPRDDSVPDDDRAVAGYDLLRVIGRGGMGIVYEARHRGLNRIVALKMIQSAALASPDDLRRFRDEAESVALLDHPNIVTIHEVGEHRGRPFYSMKKLDGGSLADRIAGPSDDPRAAAKLAADIARAVHHAHQRGILHRDLKPANILLDLQGRPYVADFGLAKRLDRDSSATQSGALLGSPSYMAPEQSKGVRAITTAADVYGLGAILYWMLAGQPPFRADSVAETLAKLSTHEPEAPRKLNPKVDRDLEAICLKTLEKEPARRYVTAEALADDLDRWLRREPILARRIGRAGRLLRWSRRNPVVAGLVLICVALVIAMIAGGIASYARIAREREATRSALEVAQARLRQVEIGNFWLTQGLTEPLKKLAGPAMNATPELADRRCRVIDESIAAYTGYLVARAEVSNHLPEAIGMWQHIGLLHTIAERYPEAWAAYREAIRVSEELVANDPKQASSHDGLGLSRLHLGWDLWLRGRRAEAEPILWAAAEDFNRSIELSDDVPMLVQHAAWYFLLGPDDRLRDPRKGLALARRLDALVGGQGKDKPSFSAGLRPLFTLGLAQYRAGDYRVARATLERSIEVRKGGDAYDGFALAMALGRLGEREAARGRFRLAERWMIENRYGDFELHFLREEGAALLGGLPLDPETIPPSPVQPRVPLTPR